MTAEKKSLHIKTFGCQMNVYDSSRMAELLGEGGYTETDDIANADMIILNTCHIREKAAEKVYSELGRIRQIKTARKQENKETVVAVAGCVAQAEGEEILKRAPVVDLVVGPQSYHRLPDMIAKADQTKSRLIDTDFQETEKFANFGETQNKQLKTDPKNRRAPTAFLTVQEGCDKFCTFCVVPYTRGMEYSRPVEDIIAEANKLVTQGVCEITLLGQNVNAYHGEGPDGKSWSLAQLLDRLSRISDLQRLRYTTSHPKDMTADLIAAHGNNEKLMPYLHLPFQAGSDRILKAMNRKHTAAEYKEIIAQMREARPDLALSTDVIVGFPGESDADFQATLDLIDDVQFAQSYSFKYSSRPGTPAATMSDQVPEHVKAERLQVLQQKLKDQQIAFNQSCVGKTLPVLFEKPGRKPNQLVGRSPYLQAVHVDIEELTSVDTLRLGEIKDVTITSAGPNSLQAVLALKAPKTLVA